MCRAIVKAAPCEYPFIPETFFRPAGHELLARSRALPALLAEALRDFLRRPGDPGLGESLTRLGRALPVAVFDNEPIRAYLEKIYTIKDRTDDFRRLRAPLRVVASDLESGRSVRFGEPGWDHVPISRAVQASTALPGLYPPVRIDGRYYVDGVLLKTLHASVALEAGADLVLCINPIVPVDLTGSGDNGGGLPEGFLVGRGLPAVLAQTMRTLIHSRLTVGLAAYNDRYRGADVVLLEPQTDDYRMFFTNIFSFSSRKAVCEHAYHATRRDLLRRWDELEPIFARHGLELRRPILEDRHRTLWQGVDASPHRLSLSERLDHALRRTERLVAG